MAWIDFQSAGLGILARSPATFRGTIRFKACASSPAARNQLLVARRLDECTRGVWMRFLPARFGYDVQGVSGVRQLVAITMMSLIALFKHSAFWGFTKWSLMFTI